MTTLTCGVSARVCCGMQAPDAVVTAVFRTLVRATADARVPVVLRCRRPEQAQALAAWLNAAHGSGRLVIASACAPALIEVRLPARMQWPATPGRMPAGPRASQTASRTTTFRG